MVPFLDNSPTSFHAADNIVKILKGQGFTNLEESEEWFLKKGGAYYVNRGSSVFAFSVPKSDIGSFFLAGAHTDSPALKLKPSPEYKKGLMTMLATEVYGGPLLNSWLNRDLMVAGKIIYQDGKGIREALIQIESPVVIPQLAIHLDRQVNEQGLLLNKQEHLNALADINGNDFLIPEIKKIVPMKALISHDLYLAPLEKARLLANGTLLASHSLDNLASCHAILEAFRSHKSRLNGAVFWDNEEIGSETSTGAASPFLEHTLERITASLGINREAHLRILSQSYLLSIDLAHAAHPNYLEKHDMSHRPILGQGPVLKWNANHRYATTGASAARLIEQAKRLKVPFQTFVSRNDMPCGTTIGPISATRLGIMAADIGIPQLSMHGIREVISVEDYNNSVKLVQGLFEN